MLRARHTLPGADPVLLKTEEELFLKSLAYLPYPVPTACLAINLSSANAYEQYNRD